MTTLYLVKHRRRLYDDVLSHWLIGWYSTRAKAEAAVARAVLLPGFRDFPTAFVSWELELDEIYDESDGEPQQVQDESSGRCAGFGMTTSDEVDPKRILAATIYQLEWFQELDDDVTDIVFIGAFSSEEKAHEAIDVVRSRPHFAGHPEGFYISDIEVDVDHSTTGFFVPNEEKEPRR